MPCIPDVPKRKASCWAGTPVSRAGRPGRSDASEFAGSYGLDMLLDVCGGFLK